MIPKPSQLDPYRQAMNTEVYSAGPYSGIGEYWKGYPAYISGVVGLPNIATETGSNLDAVKEMAFSKVGGGAGAAIPYPDGGVTF
jgi:hypothetical protein